MSSSKYESEDRIQQNSKFIKSLDSVLESIPVGWYHYRLAILCGMAFMADSMEVTLLSYISTCAGDEWGLSDSERATITSLVFGGALVGSLFWGRFADRYGRRKSFISACVVISLSGIFSGFAPSYPWLCVFRSIVGFGIGGSTVPFDLLAEFLPLSHRGKYLIFIEYFWTLGSLFVNGIAWISLSSLGWRFLTYITAAPVTLAFLIGAFYLPESPRWLLVNGKVTEAEAVLKDAAQCCGHEMSDFSLHVPEDATDGNTEVFVDLFRTPEMRSVSIPLGIVWLCFGVSYYGVILLVSRLYTTSDDDSSSTCSFDYAPIFINSSAEIVGVTIAGFVIDGLGRIKTQASFYLLGSITMVIIGFNISTTTTTVIAWFARLAAMASSCATWVATPELFPTEARATGHSLCNSTARVGAFMAPYFVDSSLSALLVAFGLAIVNIVAAVASYMLPETSDKELDQVVRVSRVSRDVTLTESILTPLSPQRDSL